MNIHPSDYRVAAATFREMFGPLLTARRPTGLRGQHMMTPDVLGYVLSGGEPVEVSTGIGLYDQRAFGLTWSRLPDGTPDQRDCLCHSLDEVRDVLLPWPPT